jgi:5'-deoxynucleotidase YfbR-like HD superfamily hydrolase
LDSEIVESSYILAGTELGSEATQRRVTAYVELENKLHEYSSYGTYEKRIIYCQEILRNLLAKLSPRMGVTDNQDKIASILEEAQKTLSHLAADPQDLANLVNSQSGLKMREYFFMGRLATKLAEELGSLDDEINPRNMYEALLRKDSHTIIHSTDGYSFTLDQVDAWIYLENLLSTEDLDRLDTLEAITQYIPTVIKLKKAGKESLSWEEIKKKAAHMLI